MPPASTARPTRGSRRSRRSSSGWRRRPTRPRGACRSASSGRGRDDRERTLRLRQLGGVEAAPLEADRSRRVGWLVSAIEELPKEDQKVLARATSILGGLSDSGG